MIANHKVSVDYQRQVLASSMKYNKELPIWSGDSKGKLILGHNILSQDKKTLAVEIKYDMEAHQKLSSFGNRYKLRLVEAKNSKVGKLKIEYGIFGTDGSGVLEITNKQGFSNESFIVMLVDTDQLLSSDDLTTNNSQVTDEEVDRCITSQLSGSQTDGQGSSDDSDKSTKKNSRPIYYVRLNAMNAQRSKRNWKDDKDIIKDLFVNANLKKIKNQEIEAQKKLKNGKRSLDEMNKRLKENKNDQVAANNKNQLESQMQSLNLDVKAAKKKYKKLKSSSFSDDILYPKQKSYSTYLVNNLEQIDQNRG